MVSKVYLKNSSYFCGTTRKKNAEKKDSSFWRNGGGGGGVLMMIQRRGRHTTYVVNVFVYCILMWIVSKKLLKGLWACEGRVSKARSFEAPFGNSLRDSSNIFWLVG